MHWRFHRRAIQEPGRFKLFIHFCAHFIYNFKHALFHEVLAWFTVLNLCIQRPVPRSLRPPNIVGDELGQPVVNLYVRKFQVRAE